MTKEEILLILQDVKKQMTNMGHDVFAVILHGSQNYGLDIYNENYKSDIDCKVFVIPSYRDMYYNTPISTTEITPYGLADVKDLRLLPELMKKANPAYIELMFTDYVVFEPNDILSLGDEIVKEKIQILFKTIHGTAEQKKAALRHPYPSILDKIERFGYDPKQLHHLVRLYYLSRDLEMGKDFNTAQHPLGDELNYLLQLKIGAISNEDVDKLVDFYMTKIIEIEKRNPITTASENSCNELERRIFNFIKNRVKETWAKGEK